MDVSSLADELPADQLFSAKAAISAHRPDRETENEARNSHASIHQTANPTPTEPKPPRETRKEKRGGSSPTRPCTGWRSPRRGSPPRRRRPRAAPSWSSGAAPSPAASAHPGPPPCAAPRAAAPAPPAATAPKPRRPPPPPEAPPLQRPRQRPPPPPAASSGQAAAAGEGTWRGPTPDAARRRASASWRGGCACVAVAKFAAHFFSR